MATLRFFTKTKLKAPVGGKAVPIYCRLKDGRKLDITAQTGLLIHPDHFDNNREVVKGVAEEQVREKNKELRDIRNWVFDQLDAEPDSSRLDKDWLAKTIDMKRHPERYQPKVADLFSFIRNFIATAPHRPNPKTGRPVSYKMQREYVRTFFYLQDFAAKKRRRIDFKDITLDFYHDFIQYLQSEKTIPNRSGEMVKEPGLAVNTIGKKIQTLKIFLNAATDEGVNKYAHYRSRRFTALSEETEHIHLNETEVQALFDLDLSDNPRLDKVRDLFIIGCWTGLRFSDWDQIRPENIEDGLLSIKQSKTGGRVYIPLHGMVENVLEKHNGVLPKVPTNQRVNEYIKEVGELAGITDPFQKTITKGGITRTVKKPKYQLIGTHTARRSFATNAYNAGVPTLTIMAITGHKTETAFLRYIKVTPKEHALKLRKFWQDNVKLRAIS